MRAYIASVEIEVVVVAENEEEARKLAVKEFQRDVENLPSPGDFDLSSFSHIPGSYWEGDEPIDFEIVPTGEGYITLDEAAKLPGGYDYKSCGKT